VSTILVPKKLNNAPENRQLFVNNTIWIRILSPAEHKKISCPNSPNERMLSFEQIKQFYFKLQSFITE
jgi:hypothetical protein